MEAARESSPMEQHATMSEQSAANCDNHESNLVISSIGTLPKPSSPHSIKDLPTSRDMPPLSEKPVAEIEPGTIPTPTSLPNIPPPKISTHGSHHGSPTPTPASSQSISEHKPDADLRSTTLHLNRRNHCIPPRQTYLRNNLLPLVGFLEFSNALDFPANVWNTIPVPTFAVGLMATGGSIAILFSIGAFLDFRLSYRNFKLLREERKQLLEAKATLIPNEDPARLSMCQAWLDLNFREIGWEFTDRMLMDALNGFAGILVGAGTMLAIGGANPRMFEASNLLSGYIGNSFNVVYGAVNTIWSVYMWRRQSLYKSAVREKVKSPSLKKRVRGHTRRHQLYAAVNGISVFVAAIGSMVSVTMWQGYVVLLPCVFAAVFTNLLWRRGIGYDRELFPRRSDALEMDVETKLLDAIESQTIIKSKGTEALLSKDSSGEKIVDFMVENEMFEVLCKQLMVDTVTRHTVLGVKGGPDPKSVAIDRTKLESLNTNDLIKHAEECLRKKGFHHFQDQERMLAELWGCQLSQRPQPGRRSSEMVELKSPVEKDV